LHAQVRSNSVAQTILARKKLTTFAKENKHMKIKVKIVDNLSYFLNLSYSY